MSKKYSNGLYLFKVNDGDGEFVTLVNIVNMKYAQVRNISYQGIYGGFLGGGFVREAEFIWKTDLKIIPYTKLSKVLYE